MSCNSKNVLFEYIKSCRQSAKSTYTSLCWISSLLPSIFGGLLSRCFNPVRAIYARFSFGRDFESPISAVANKFCFDPTDDLTAATQFWKIEGHQAFDFITQINWIDGGGRKSEQVQA